MGYMVLTDSGHTAIAEAVNAQEMWLAWGDIPAFIQPPSALALQEISGGGLTIGTYQYVVTAVTEFGETLASTVAIINVSADNSTVRLTWTPPESGGQALTFNVYGRIDGSMFYIDNTSTPTYDDVGGVIGSVVPPPSTNTTSFTPWDAQIPSPDPLHNRLLSEVGRRRIIVKNYVVPDDQGGIVTLSNKWSVSVEPTRHLYLYVAFDLEDAADETVYQFGIFLNTVPIPGYEAANYLAPAQVQERGTLLSLEHTSPIYRNSATREVHEIVVTF